MFREGGNTLLKKTFDSIYFCPCRFTGPENQSKDCRSQITRYPFESAISNIYVFQLLKSSNATRFDEGYG